MLAVENSIQPLLGKVPEAAAVVNLKDRFTYEKYQNNIWTIDEFRNHATTIMPAHMAKSE
jgi:hypothetical protein